MDETKEIYDELMKNNIPSKFLDIEKKFEKQFKELKDKISEREIAKETIKNEDIEIFDELGEKIEGNLYKGLNFIHEMNDIFKEKIENNELQENSDIYKNAKEIVDDYKKKFGNNYKSYKNTLYNLKTVSEATLKEDNMKNKISNLHEKLVNGIRNLKDNIKDYIKMLDVYRRNSYSLNNNLYIEQQLKERNEASGQDIYEGKYMNTYRGWKELGYSVNKGEKAISLIFPRRVDYFIDENNVYKSLKYATKEQKEKIEKGQLEKGTFNTYFSKGALFDIKQTNCPEYEVKQAIEKLKPQPLQAVDNKSIDMLIKDFSKYLEKDGFKVEHKELENNLKGYVTENKEIVLNKKNTNTQNFKTLLHEYAHYESGHLSGRNDLSKEMKEVEAESIAYIVCKNHGIDTSDYSFKYLTHYGKNNIDMDIIKSQDTIKSVSNSINSTLENLNQLRIEKSNLENEIKEKYGELEVKILDSQNTEFKKEEVISLKELSERMEKPLENNVKIGILDEAEKRIISFEMKNNQDKEDLYSAINSTEKLKQALNNQINTIKPVQEVTTTVEKTTTKTQQVHSASMGMDM